MNICSTTTSRLIGTICLSLPVLFQVPAIQAQDGGWYAGAGAGWTGTNVQRGRIVTNLQGAGYNTVQFDSDDKDKTYKAFAGYDFNGNIALEASYFDLGTFNFNAALQPAAIQSGHASVNGFGLDVVGRWPVAGGISAFLKAGINSARVEQDFTNNVLGSGFINHTETGVHEKYGAGLAYKLNDTLSIQAELERYRVDSNRVTGDHVDALTVGIVYRFGSRKAVSARPAPPQQPAAPTARTDIETTPAPQPPLEITLSANTLFDFDRATLRSEGRNALDALVRDMADLVYEVVIVTGHTDRIGTRDYNLGLSRRRADTVRNYLIGAGVPEGVITASGVNSDEPVTSAGQCTGPVTDALKACLQPDRRVVVEVTGVINE